MFAYEVDWAEPRTETNSVDTVEPELPEHLELLLAGDTRRIIGHTGVIPLVHFTFAAKHKLQYLR